MNVIFKYEENKYVKVNTISVIGKFNEYNPAKGIMKKEENNWVFQCDLPKGEHPYKFVINGNLKLNDPTANIYLPDENEELWSIVMINEEGKRLYNNNQYTVNIDKYNICSAVSEEENLVNKKNFNILTDKRVVHKFKFTNVTGLHSVTVAWYTPKGELFQVTENNLFKTSQDDKPIVMWFWMDLQENFNKYPCGIWTMRLFLDGDFILEDNFELLEGMSYSAKGKIKY